MASCVHVFLPFLCRVRRESGVECGSVQCGVQVELRTMRQENVQIASLSLSQVPVA